MTYSAAQQVLLQRLGIETLQLHKQFGSASPFLASNAAVIDTNTTNLCGETIPESELLHDLQLALKHVDCVFQPTSHQALQQAQISGAQLVMPWPLSATNKRQLWQLISSLDPS